MKQYILDTFTERIFHGNQAAVCVLDYWLSDEMMMNITKENNFSETAFTVKNADGYDLRWFTPGGEIDLCGHATLAASYVLFKFYETDNDKLIFHTTSGDLFVSRQNDLIAMNFPAYHCRETAVISAMTDVFGIAPIKAYIYRDLLLVYENEEIVRSLKPDFEKMVHLEGQGVGVTAPGKEYDCVSRFFAPKLKVNEDPVTGSAHCMIAPYWVNRLGKSTINAYQASERGGELICEMKGDRVVISGKTVLYSVSELNL